jgi:hypothetical protein
VAAPLLLALLLVRLEVTTEALAESRFRLTVVIPAGADYELITRAQLRLMEEAARVCGARRAVSEGGLMANQVPTRRNRVAVSEIYNCVATGR